MFVTATPDDDGLTLFRVEADRTLSPSLYFFGSASGNLIEGGLLDANHLYLSEDDRLLRVPLDSASGITQPAEVLTKLDPSLRITGDWAVDADATPDRVVFEPRDDFDTGMICINSFGAAEPNMPFGGVKDYGYGREHGGFGMKESVNVNAIFTAVTAPDG